MSKLLQVFLLSAVPIIEQKGAIPKGILDGLNPMTVFWVSFLGSMLPVPFILLLFNKIFEWMKRYEFFDKINTFIEKKINKNSSKIEKYKEIGLITFIAIPLPTTGVWTGSVVAAFLKLDFKKSVICAAIGALISALIITGGMAVFPAVYSKVFGG
ncbi:small multi-drug export protein [Clostridium botulinum]|uniref:Ligand-binding protein SH3 n=1 Tax=Clostridium botulinum C/D str. DC5 TaxID=1443128 RepID=A0A0A0ICF5_CLOBO|nr:small multi-drug export protein [Clostridium botulinum]KEI00486.1 ligand-binding protein SH3 [Clostridium botulinum C/D str. BKT75002]KEI07316.1 ligand-binding protein SH3 [Clostridium botulinum C/D str. BKT2873]KGM94582.1 ligand-binding protein SH3 [Clostridium botulinum D str. CCUG 7971]KGM98056.1 ligand-binding protein SH3 [Clostridium botulinum C/D str. DC5]KOC49446.1 ligand-binding protein SH3 [Clostridium botulinum]